MIKFKKYDSSIKRIYQNILDSSRSKLFYLDYDVEDTFESRFDIIVLHSFIIFQYFLDYKIKKSEISQSLFDYMFDDFDNNLREMGFGDIAVNKKMKSFIVAFYGRVANYSKGIEKFRLENSIDLLSTSIKKNIYKGNKKNDFKTILLSNYILDNLEYFSSKPHDSNIKNNFKFNIKLGQIL